MSFAEDPGAPLRGERAVPPSFPLLEQSMACLRPDLVRIALGFAVTRADAEDLVQEAYARALDPRRRFRPETNLRSWLKRVIQNLAIDHARKRTVRLRGPEPVHSPAENDGTEETIELSPGDLRSAVGSLPSPLRRSAELRFLEQRSYVTIAAELGIPISTVGTRLLRARRWLRAFIAAAQDGEAPTFAGRVTGIHSS